MANETRVKAGNKGGDRLPNTDQSLVLDVNQTAALLNCSPRTVIRLSNAKKLPRPMKLGSLTRWSRKSIEQYVERQTRKESRQ